MADLYQHVAVITGASGALGEWVTKAFLKAGAQVVGIARESRPPSANIRWVAGDLTSASGASAALDAAQGVHNRIDSLIHLAGGFSGGKVLADTEPEAFDAMFDANVRSAFLAIRAVIPHMRASGGGRIVLTASRAALEPAPQAALYAASKAALVSLARTVAAEEAKYGITANAVLPGTMDTDKNRAAMPSADFSKWVKPADVAALMVHLVSPAGAAITGAAIPVLGRDV
jgi:NAD(P)-dependent dehydrogenase (short-subunit alcohol dehydrogenase family)